MIKNERHSHAAKMLAIARELYKAQTEYHKAFGKRLSHGELD